MCNVKHLESGNSDAQEEKSREKAAAGPRETPSLSRAQKKSGGIDDFRIDAEVSFLVFFAPTS